MLRFRIRRSAGEWFLMIVFWAFVLQDPLMKFIPMFAYIDELFGAVGVLALFYQIFRKGKLSVKKADIEIFFSLFAFVCVGLLGNLIYGYQPWKAVLKDLYVNLKFFLSIVAGYSIFTSGSCERKRDLLVNCAKTAVVILFALLVVDLIFHVFRSPELRYGLRTVQLMYSHATYLAGIGMFLLAILTIFYKKENQIYIILCLCVTFFTLRGKSLAGTLLYPIIFYFCAAARKKLRVWHIILLGAVALFIAWDQFSYYYLELEGSSARSALTMTSFEILIDYFPIGTGFGTYASNVAAEFYSPVYSMYGLNVVHGLSEINTSFGSDTFWPIIIGQSGFIGLCFYVYMLYIIFRRVLKIRNIDIYAYTAGVFIFAYLMISSTSEPTFCNSMSIPLACVIGIIYAFEKNGNRQTTEVSK